MRSLSNREKYLIAFLGIAILLFIYAKMFLLPVLDKIQISQATVQDYQSQINELKLMETVNQTLNKALGDLQQKYEAALTQLPDQPRNPEVAYKLKPIADLSSITLQSVTLGDGELVSNPAVKDSTENTEVQEGKDSDQNGSASTPQGKKIYSMPVTIDGKAGTYADVMGFVDLIEKDKRFTHITSMNISSQGESGDGILSFNISVDYYYTNESNEKPTYFFNNGQYGKTDLFR